jgi:hypothetical protein
VAGRARSTRGWPTNVTGIPASRYRASSKGKITIICATLSRIARTRPRRHAHTCGET